MNYRGLQRYRTGDPGELEADLQRQNAAVRDALRELEQEREDRPRPRVSAASTEATFGEFVLTDSATGSLSIALPKPKRSDEGRSVYVGRKSAANTVTVTASAGANVNGAASIALSAAVGFRRFTVADGDWFAHLT